MRSYFRTPLILMVSWCLLFVCLFLVSVALAEQTNLLPETSPQDEYALSKISSVLKTKAEQSIDCLRSSVAIRAIAHSCLTSPDEPRWTHCMTDLESPSLPLHQRLSVYRI